MRVTHVLRYDAGLYRGGGEIKAEKTREALTALGVEIQVHEPLSADMGDLVHFFGSMGYFWTLADFCRKKYVPYICSPIFVTPRSPARLRWRKLRMRVLKGKSNLARLFEGAAELYFQTGREKANFEAFYGAVESRGVTVPNGVESRFAEGDPALFRQKFGIADPFILQTGTIGPNKGQLDLIRAAKPLGMTVVLLGRSNDADYVAACRNAAGPEVHFLDSLPHEDPLLPSAYAAAEVFCLPSSDDIFANSAMEAAVAGCRLILGDSWGGQEVYGDWASWVRPGDPDAIRAALAAKTRASHNSKSQSAHFLATYSWKSVAELLKSRYEAVLKIV